jgi:hypothetical protein
VSLALFGSFVTAASLTQADTTLLNNRVRGHSSQDTWI